MRQARIQVFTFDELSEKAKDRARQWYSEGLETWWSEPVQEDARRILAFLGFSELALYWAGFCSQGDGACFIGRFDKPESCLRAIEAEGVREEAVLQAAQELDALPSGFFARLKHSGHYYHEGSVYVDDGEKTDAEGETVSGSAEDEADFIGAVRVLCKWFYKSLESAYEWHTSDEAIAEYCEANEWEFTADGSPFLEK